MPRPKKTKPNRSDERYEVKKTIGHRMDGKPIRKSFYSTISLQDAEAKAEEYLMNQKISSITGVNLITRNVPFSEAAELWLENKRNSDIKEYTYITTYESKYRLYIKPYFSQAYINNIQPYDVDMFFNKHRDLSASVRKKLLIILNGIFKMSITYKLCQHNPASHITVSEKEYKSTKRVYNADDEEKLFSYCLTNGYIDIAILLDTGIRRSELLGLRWEDIDLKNKVIHINQAITPGGSRGAEPVVDVPKSRTSIRAIPISSELANALKEHADSGYVVKGTKYDYMTPSGYAKNFRTNLNIIADQLNIEKLTPHELRHTFGTFLRKRGSDIYTIQKAMGHSSIEISAKTYVKNDIEVLRHDMGRDEEKSQVKVFRVVKRAKRTKI